eukprot:gene2308-2776_t
MSVVTQVEILITYFQYLGMMVSLAFHNFPESAKFFAIFIDGLKALFDLIPDYSLDQRAEYVILIGLIPLFLVIIGGIPWKSAHFSIIYTSLLVILIQLFFSLSFFMYVENNFESKYGTVVGRDIPSFVKYTLFYYNSLISFGISAVGLLLILVYAIIYSIISILKYRSKMLKKNEKEKENENEEEERVEENTYEKRKLKDLPLKVTRVASSYQGNFNTTNNGACMSCGIPNPAFACPTGMYDSLCTGSSTLRLQVDPAITCGGSFFALFIPLGIILTIFVVVGLPILGCYSITHATYYLQKTKVQHLLDTEEYQRKVKKHIAEQKSVANEIELNEADFDTQDVEFDKNVPDKSLSNRLMNKIGLGSKPIKEEEGESSKLNHYWNLILFIFGFKYSPKKWKYAMYVSPSGINGFFDAYTFWFRYWGVWKLIEKFCLAIVVLFFFPFGAVSSGIGLGITLVIHMISIIATIIFRPYNAFLSNILSIFCSIFLILSTIYILISSVFQLPPELSIIVLACNGVAGIFGIITTILNGAFDAYFSFKALKLQKIFKKKYPDENQEHQKHNKIIKSKINENVISNVSNYILVYGAVTLTIVLTIILAVVSTTKFENLSQDSLIELFTGIVAMKPFESEGLDRAQYAKNTCNQTIPDEYAGYGNWNKFVENCCCTNGGNVAQNDITTVRVEQWFCNNGIIKRRVRETIHGQSSAVYTGYAARDFCAADFKPGFSRYCAELDAEQKLYPTIKIQIPDDLLGERFVYWNGTNQNADGSLQDLGLLFW